MPDSLGRYTLAEMQDRVRRELNDAILTVNTSTGDETTSPVLPTQLYSNTDINIALNNSMIEGFIEMATNHEEIFAQITYISTQGSFIGPYALPANMIKLRWLKWKSPAQLIGNIRPDQWQPMAYYDEDLSSGQGRDFSGGRSPSYQRVGNNIYLNENQYQSNTNGIMVNSVIIPPELVNPDDVVQSQFARPMQSFMIFDAAVHIGESREEQISDELKSQRDRSHVLMMAALDNALQPPTVQIVSGRLVKTTYSGRR